MQYNNEIAVNYGNTRKALFKVLSYLNEELLLLPQNAKVVDIGCGTGDYIIELEKKFHNELNFYGFDLSKDMLKISKNRCNDIEFKVGNADVYFPYSSSFADLLICIYVIHFINNLDVFFKESNRILNKNGRLIIATESENDIRCSSLSKYFPEAKEIHLKRLYKKNKLIEEAKKTGLTFLSSYQIKENMTIDESLINKIRIKFDSTFYSMSERAFNDGIKNVIRAKKHNEKWLININLYKFVKNNNSHITKYKIV